MISAIENIPAYKIAYVRRIGPYGTDNIQTMEKLKKWAKDNNLFNGETIILGIAHDNPKMVNPEKCRYDTCIVISNEFSPNDNYISKGSIVGGRYAIFKIKHTKDEVQKAWAQIFPELFKHGYEFDETRPIIERYLAQMVNNHFCEICMPVY